MTTRSVFVQVAGGTDGVGKLVSADKTHAEIEYFESPSGPRVHRARVSVARIREVELSPQTRIFWFDPERQTWRAGRVDEGLISADALKTSEDHYHVRFPNGIDARVPVSELYVRWARPIEDPTDYLAARITDTPFFFDGRCHIVRHLAGQRAAFGGVTALASSAIDLLEHQVSTVRRILADPTERYLLADEVGLGKTVEAGILIRQHILDHADANVLIVTPAHLVAQWTDELADKFYLASDSRARVMSEDTLAGSVLELGQVTMLVADEVHRHARNAFALDTTDRRVYEALRQLATTTPRVLLLSGTPVRHQEDSFLAMLHLLDPEAYPLDDIDSFRRRVQERQRIAEVTLDLSDDASPYFAEEALQILDGLFPDDRRLGVLCRDVRAKIALDPADRERVRALRSIRTHLAERYRLHRRLLRTRRDDRRVQDHLPRRTGLRRLPHDDRARAEAFDFIETFRLRMSIVADFSSSSMRLFAHWVDCALSHPRVLLRQIECRLALLDEQNRAPLHGSNGLLLGVPSTFEGEEQFLRERHDLINAAASDDPRTRALLAWLSSDAQTKKVIVFVDDSRVADEVATTMQSSLGPKAVVRYRGGSDVSHAFEDSPLARVLVCDAHAEEGLNLQRSGAALVHFDLPLDATRIEQRIGRIDRLEARGRMRNFVLTSVGPYESEWLDCLDQTIRVFDRSIAPLQFVVADATARIRTNLALSGTDAITDESARLGDSQDGLEAELRRIRAQEALDSIENDSDEDADFFRRLEQADELAESGGADALNAWVVDRLHFVCDRSEDGVLRYLHDSRRPTLLPLFDTYARFPSCIDPDPRARRRHTLPFRRITLERGEAQKRDLGLLRVGHPFVDGVEALVRADDRGMAFAMWRHCPRSVRAPRLYLRFDFIMEVDLCHALGRLDGVGPEALRRRADGAFPVQYRTVWLTSDLEEVRHTRLRSVLELPYSQHPRSNGGRDRNIRLERWELVDALCPTTDWSELCHRGRQRAEEIIRNDVAFSDECARHASRTRTASQRVASAWSSRIDLLDGRAKGAEERASALEIGLAEALAQGIEQPRLRVDSTGAVFLSSEALEIK